MVHLVSFFGSRTNWLLSDFNCQFANICELYTCRHVQADSAIYRRLPQQTSNCSVCFKDVSPKQYVLFTCYFSSIFVAL
jgi:hypothetical protein